MKKVVLFSVLALSVAGAFADSIADSSNYTPGGKYRLFGNGRGTVTNLTNYINVSGGLTQQVGNLAISTTAYSGGLSYEMQFHNHGWEVHSPFSNKARQDFHTKNGKIVNGGGATLGGATLTDLSVTGYEIHPADGYDGEQGGGYPTPTGARDEYLYTVNGKEVSIKIVNPDKVPPKANDDKILKNVGIDPAPYDKNQSKPSDRPTFEKLKLVYTNENNQSTEYNGGVENGSVDTSTNGNGWNNAETGSPLSLYDGQHDSNPYGVQPYHLSPASLTTDGNAATPDTRTEFQKARDNWINCQGSACGQAGSDFIKKNPTWNYMPTVQTGQNLAEGDVSGAATDLALSKLPVKGGKNVKTAIDKANDAKNAGKNVAKNTPTTSGGTANSATYPKLKQDLRQQNLDNIAKQDPRLAKAAQGSGSTNPNYSIGSGTRAEADQLGKTWVGDGARRTSNGGWESADGTLRYRPPSAKPNTPIQYNPTGTQANFEQRIPNPKTGKMETVSNGHLTITD